MIRVKVRVESRIGASVETAAIANSGYGSVGPEAIVPLALAKRLVSPHVLRDARTREYAVAGGRLERFSAIPEELKISVVTEDRVEGPIITDMVISGGEAEVIIGDEFIESLKVALEKPASGLWRFYDEPSSRVRRSVKPERWV